jgi:predicted ribosome quality control (RQC) complex YloA/Tae2 family protein
MLGLRELRRAARLLQDRLTGATLRRVMQPDANQIVLIFDRLSAKSHVLISIKPEYARICLTDPIESDNFPGSFCEYMRAHLPGTSFAGIDSSGENRQIEIPLQRESRTYLLILSILGTRSNLYLLDSDRKLLHSMRTLEETRRELKLGEPWTDPHGVAPAEGIDRWENLRDEEYLDAIGQTYRQLERKGEGELLARRIEQALKKEKSFLNRKAVNLQEDLGEAREAESYKYRGELLKNVLHTVRPGDEVVMATDYRTGNMIEIPLDPKLSPAANLESYFARYQKESRGVKMIEQQLVDLAGVRTEIEALGKRLQEAVAGDLPDVQALKGLSAEPRLRRLMHRSLPGRKPGNPPVQSTAKRDVPVRLMPKRYRTQDGLEIWVGKNDEGNDFLTTRLARGNDLFFHLEGYPGSHVVLRTDGRPDPPPKSLLEACELAVHFSRMKNAGNADVHMAHIKDVKKPKGAKPGLVYVRSGKTIHLRRDPKRLQSILASKLD